MRRLSSLLVALLLPLAACKVTPAGAAPPPPYLTVEHIPSSPADSACFGFVWGEARDEAGAATAYHVVFSWMEDSTAREAHQDVTDRQTSACWVRAPGVERHFTIDVFSVRRGVQSDSASTREWTWTDADEPPPAPGPITVTPIDSAPVVTPDPPSDVPPIAGLFATPRDTSPHYDFIRRTFTDFCYCWDGAGSLARAARRYDMEMSGNRAAWKAANPAITTLRYALLWSTLDEANGNADDLPNRFQWDARTWFAAHPAYDYETAWLHVAGDSTPADSAHRIRTHIWSTYRFVGNPADSGWRAYTVDRLVRAAADPETGGLFLDEMDSYNLGQIGRSREFAGRAAEWQDAIVSLVAEVRAAIAPRMLQVNPAGYGNRDLDVRIALAAGAVHLETMNHATQDLPAVWTLADSLVRRGVYVDLVNLESWKDFEGGTGKLSRESYYPRGNYARPVYRAKIVQLASYYMVVPADAQAVGLMDNGIRAPLTPDSVELPVYSLDVGHPTGPRRVVLDTRDALAQRARVYRRDFDNATVLIRPVVYWGDTVLTDTTAVPVPLPEGSWSMVTARGGIVPVDSLALRNSEAVILVRRD